MITKDNFRSVLDVLGFTRNNATDIYYRDYKTGNTVAASMAVDFAKKELIFPEKMVGGQRNTSFNQNENFVVFECVCRLLDKGYCVQDIELEHEWPLGHSTKSGRADIWIRKNDTTRNTTTSFLIIECKTAGKEYKKAIDILRAKNQEVPGGQLFSYWQQSGNVKWISLYASDLVLKQSENEDNSVIYEDFSIRCSDDPNIEKLAEKDKDIRLYKSANSVQEKHLAWLETYNSESHSRVIFDEDNSAYNIEVCALKKKKLEKLTQDVNLSLKFQEILRHNNIHNYETGFDCFTALVLCKLFDESEKNDNEILDFQYKEGIEDYETFLERLLNLYNKAKEEFLQKKVFSVAEDYAEQFVTNLTKGATHSIEELRTTIRKLKLYTTNAFSFIKVETEEEFLLNGKITAETVLLMQNYQFSYTHKDQILSDMFEGFLKSGIKETSGQYFTAMPIVQFIWHCLPIENIINKSSNKEKGIKFPKIIDFACGAAHFLTEGAENVRIALKNDSVDIEKKHPNWEVDHIYGIEKDNRLVNVAKICLIMSGIRGGKIIFGDGLENYKEQNIIPGTFDILVSNPPFSVPSFRESLSLKENKGNLKLLAYTTEKSGDIQNIFIERIGQLLKPKGIAAIVMPSTILNNGDDLYIQTRKIILQNFFLRAIINLGGKTFGETGTTTATLFLERYNEPPCVFQQKKDIAHSIITKTKLDNNLEIEIKKHYLLDNKINEDDYNQFICEKKKISEWSNVSYFSDYLKEFLSLTEVKNKIAKINTENEKEDYLKNAFYTRIKMIEGDKLLYYSLAFDQKTVVISAPSDINEQRKFLGYTWEKKFINQNCKVMTSGGLLYNPDNRLDNTTLAAAVRSSFTGEKVTIDDEKTKYVVNNNLINMIDFSRTTFDCVIKANVQYESAEVKYKDGIQIVKLGDVCEAKSGLWTGKKPPFKSVLVIRNTNFTMTGELNLTDVAQIEVEENQFNERQLQNGDIIIEKSGGSSTQAVGRVVLFENITGEYSYSNFTTRLRVVKKFINPKFLHIFLNDLYQKGYTFDFQSGVSGLKNLNLNRYLAEISIPIPSTEVQNHIVTECTNIDDGAATAKAKIAELKNKIENMFKELFLTSNNTLKLSDSLNVKLSIGKRVLNTEVNPEFEYPVYSANVFEPFGNINKLLINDFSVSSVVWGIDGDWMVNTFDKGFKFYPTDHCGVLRVNQELAETKYIGYALNKVGQKEGFRRSYRASIDRISSLSLPLPPLAEQKKIVKQVEKLEAEIAGAQTICNSAAAKKQAILEKYLMQ